jgi:hypothetical protein
MASVAGPPMIEGHRRCRGNVRSEKERLFHEQHLFRWHGKPFAGLDVAVVP